MAKKLIPFEEALRGIIKETDEVMINALYPAKNETIKLYPDETGYDKEQLFSREEDLKFFYAKNILKTLHRYIMCNLCKPFFNISSYLLS